MHATAVQVVQHWRQGPLGNKKSQKKSVNKKDKGGSRKVGRQGRRQKVGKERDVCIKDGQEG